MKSQEEIAKELDTLKILKERAPHNTSIKFDNQMDLDLDSVITALEWCLK